MKPIASAQHPLIKQARRLLQTPTAYRDLGCFILDGVHAVEELTCVRNGLYTIDSIITDAQSAEQPEVRGLLNRLDARLLHVAPRSLLERLLPGHRELWLLALVRLPAMRAQNPAPQVPTLYLDAVQDAGNVGSLLRTAAAAGIARVALGRGCAALYAPKVLRAAMGAHFHLQLDEQVDLTQELASTQLPVLAADVQGTMDLYDADLSAPHHWLMGSEGQGIAPELLARCAARLRIPQAGPQSLNVAAAAAICLFESRRQQLRAARGPSA